MPRTTVALAAALLLVPGCHARFKKHVGNIDDARSEAYSVPAPRVSLGKLWGDDPVSFVVNVGQTVNEFAVQRRIEEAVDPAKVGYALQDGMGDALGEGPPFAYSDQRTADAVVQLEVTDWGLTVPAIGAPGEFHYNVRVRIYQADGKLVYKSSTRCGGAVGRPNELSLALGTVNNVGQVMDMEDAEIQAAFDETAQRCGQEIARKMRKHAG